MEKLDLNTVYNHLVEVVYSDDIESQVHYLRIVSEMRSIPVEYLLQRGCLFIPNNDYIRHYLGKEAYTYGCEFYIEDSCLWALYVLIPIKDLSGEIVGIVGWDFQNKYLEVMEGQKGLPMYRVSSKNVFPREKYFLSDIDVLKRYFDKRTIFIVDGVFDSLCLNYRDLPAISLLGSTFSQEILYFLRWYKNIYVICDNDSAGNILFQRLKNSLSGVYRISQNKTKDIEELLRSEDLNGNITQQLIHIRDAAPRMDIILET